MPLASKHILQIAVDKVSYFFVASRQCILLSLAWSQWCRRHRVKKKKAFAFCAGIAYSELHYFVTYSGVCFVSVCTVSQLTCVLIRTSRRTLEKMSAMLGSSSTPFRGFMLRLRKSRWGILDTMVQI